MLGKPLALLAASDVADIVDRQAPEDQNLELKEGLPTKAGRASWGEQGGEVGERARNSILKELVAFANSTGGTLVLGIEETDTHPRRAAGVRPIPRCHDLAERLKDQIGTGIEPKLPGYEIAGIPTDADGSGVVVIRVASSHTAPHRHVHDKECYVRRRDRSEPLTMWEIQELTLAIARTGDRLTERFAERRSEFRRRSKRVPSRLKEVLADVASPPSWIAARAGLVPLTPVSTTDVHRDVRFHHGPGELVEVRNQGPEELPLPFFRDTRRRPVLRGTMLANAADPYDAWLEMHNDGFCEIGIKRLTPVDREAGLFLGWVLALVANALLAAERFRLAAEAPGLHYGMEVEFASQGERLAILASGPFIESVGTPAGMELILPQYHVGDRSEFQNLISLVERDLFNVFGADDPPGTVVDFSGPLATLDKATAR